MPQSEPIHILLVEDNPGDIRLMLEVLAETGAPIQTHVATDGVKALRFLRQHAMFRPILILLDLNLPRKDGREVLAEIKTDPGLKCIPVIILTTSAAESDVEKAYELNANCYIVKPLGLDQFYDVVRAMKDFWLSTATLPIHCV